MTIQEIYDLAVEMGMKADPRGIASVNKYLQKNKDKYDRVIACPTGVCGDIL